jgi:hypothetical protein
MPEQMICEKQELGIAGSQRKKILLRFVVEYRQNSKFNRHQKFDQSISEPNVANTDVNQW